MAGPNWKLEDDLKTVTISFPTTPPIAFGWNTAAVEDHLDKLGEFRAHMKPAVEAEWKPGQPIGAIADPRWYVEPEMMQGHSLIHLRDPRFGWLHYMIPREEARKLGQLLIRQADRPLEPPPAKPS